jgi:hypothetical protein
MQETIERNLFPFLLSQDLAFGRHNLLKFETNRQLHLYPHFIISSSRLPLIEIRDNLKSGKHQDLEKEACLPCTARSFRKHTME